MKLFFILALLFLHQIAHSQIGGARNFALGNAILTQNDLLSAQANISKLAYINGFTSGISSSNQFFQKELQRSLIGFGFPLLKGGFALSLNHYGFSLYNDIEFSIGYSISLNPAFSLGIRINYHKISLADNLKQQGSIFPNIACNYSFNEELELSILLTNLTLTKATSFGNYSSPITFQAGLGYKLNLMVKMYFESALDLEQSIRFRYGIEYSVVGHLTIRTGIATHPSTFSLGLGYEIKNLNLDVSSSFHSTLGFSPAISIRYEAK